MANSRPPLWADALHSVWLLALEVPLLYCASWIFLFTTVFLLPWAWRHGAHGTAAVELCVAVVLLAVAVALPLAGVLVPVRLGYRIVPVVLGLVGPALVGRALWVITR